MRQTRSQRTASSTQSAAPNKRLALAAVNTNTNTPKKSSNEAKPKPKSIKPAAKTVPSSAVSQIAVSKVASPELSPLESKRNHTFGLLDGHEPLSLRHSGFLPGFSFDFCGDVSMENGMFKRGGGGLSNAKEEKHTPDDEDDLFGFSKANREFAQLRVDAPLRPRVEAAKDAAAAAAAVVPLSPVRRSTSPTSVSTDSSPLAPGQKKQFQVYSAFNSEDSAAAQTKNTKRRLKRAADFEEDAGAKKARVSKAEKENVVVAPQRRSTRTTTARASSSSTHTTKRKLAVYEDPSDESDN